MADNRGEREGQRPGAQWVLAGVAVVAIVAFLWWLGNAAQPTQVKVAEGGTAADSAAASEEASATAVPVGEFATNPTGYEGQTIRLTGLEVASMLGTEAFWIQLPNQVPFLIKLDSAGAARGAPLKAGARVTVTGTVFPMKDSVLTAWEQSGAIQAGQRDEASFANAFFAAHRALVSNAAAGSASQPQNPGE